VLAGWDWPVVAGAITELELESVSAAAAMGASTAPRPKAPRVNAATVAYCSRLSMTPPVEVFGQLDNSPTVPKKAGSVTFTKALESDQIKVQRGSIAAAPP